MSLALTVQAMAAAGCTAEQIAAVVAAHEQESEAKKAAKRAKNAARMRELRRGVRDVARTNAHVRDVARTPPPKKERVPPTPPLQEKTPSPLSEANASLVPGGPGTRNAQRNQRVELFQTVVGMWNDLAAAIRLVAVRDITPARQAAILARSEDLVKTYDFPDAIEGWRKLMGFVRGSPFLRGERNGFRCDFDFITRASSFTKIMEGKYEAPTQAFGQRR